MSRAGTFGRMKHAFLVGFWGQKRMVFGRYLGETGDCLV